MGKIKERKEAKLGARLEELKERTSEEYSAKNNKRNEELGRIRKDGREEGCSSRKDR